MMLRSTSSRCGHRSRKARGRLARTVLERRTRKIGRARAQLRQQIAQRFERDLRRHQQRDLIEDLIDARHARPGAEPAAAVELDHELDLGAGRQGCVQRRAGDLERADQPAQVRPGELALHDRDLERMAFGRGTTVSTVWCMNVRRAGRGAPRSK